MSVVYVTSYYPSATETFRGHFIEKQAKKLEKKLNEQVIVFKPILSSKSSKKILHENFNGTDVYTLSYPNYFRYTSIYKTTNKVFNLFKKDIDQLLGEDKPSLIVSNDVWASLKLGNILSQVYSSKHINIVHGESPNLSLVEKKINLKIKEELLTCDKVFAVSNKIKYYIKKNFEYKKEIIVNGNGIEQKVINKYLNYQYKKNDIMTIVSIGNINYNKGFDIIIEALKDLEVPYKYIIIGDGEYKKKLLRLINKYGLEEKIIFTGNLNNDQVFDILVKSNIFALPSRNEAFGIVYLEAMITRNICIGTKGQGCEDFISNKENGFLISNENEIRNIISDYFYGKIERNMGGKAAETAKLYSWDKNVNKLANEYLKLIKIS